MVPDVIDDGLDVLFCGINPGLYSAAVGHHFARPGNRFWKTLFGAGWSDRLLAPSDERELLSFGVGITNLVARSSATAAELSREELQRGAAHLEAKLGRYRPGCLAVLGVEAYRSAFGVRASVGPQPSRVADVATWVLPNPSGLQAHYQLPQLIELFSALRRSVTEART